MAYPSPVTSLENTLSSAILGALNVGRYSVLVGSPEGILLSTIGQASSLVAQSVPVLQLPPAPQRFVGRQPELAVAIAAIRTHQSLEITGPPGIGKATFLRQLSHHADVTTSHPDGIIYLYQVKPLPELLQTIGESFYHIYPDSKLTAAEWQVSLAELQLLIILPDPHWPTSVVQALQSILVESTIVVASTTPRGIDRLQSLTLPPLSHDQSIDLATAILGRQLSISETRGIAGRWEQFQGQPCRLVQVFELLRQKEAVRRDPTPDHHDRPDALQLLIPPDNNSQLATERLMQLLLTSLSTPQRWILGLLSSLTGTGLTAQQIASMTGPQEPQASLQGLVRLALVQQVAGRYSVPAHAQPWIAQQFDSQPWMDRGAMVLADWLVQQPPESILTELPVAIVFLRWAVQQKQWQLVLQFVRALDSALVLGKQWETWGRTLQWGLQAAKQLDDRATEAWTWHQLGVRALCLEDITTAYDALHQALRLRQELNDAQGTALTQKNLTYLMQGTIPAAVQIQSPNRDDRGDRRRTNITLAVISLITFLLTVTVVMGVSHWWSHNRGINSAEVKLRQ
jgi:hypothetical protein